VLRCAVLQVRFSTKSFGLEAAQVAAEALRAVAHSLTHADMSDIIAGRPVRAHRGGWGMGTGTSRARAECLHAVVREPAVKCSQGVSPPVPRSACTAIYAHRALHTAMCLGKIIMSIQP